MRRFTLFVLCSSAVVRVSSAQATRPDTAADPYRWLEDVNGERAMTWVKAENAKTSGVLEKDPRFAGIYKTALAMAQAKDRIPYASFMAGALYNFWQDSRTCAASGAGPRSRATAPRRPSGRPCSTSTRWQRRRRPTGCGMAPTARNRRSGGVS